MASFGSAVLPCVAAGILIWGCVKKADVFGVFVQGAKDSVRPMANVFPSLVCLMLCINLFRASGAMDVLCSAVGSFTSSFFPGRVLPLVFLRPLSGAGALAAFEDILSTCGPDSFEGRVASVLMGSTETTFYTIALYYGAVKIKKGRHTLPCALSADIAGFLASAVFVKLFFYR